MARNLKVLGLALFVVLAMAAAAAPVAPAVTHTFHVNKLPTHLTSEALGSQVFELVPGSNESVICKKVSFKGTVEKEVTESITVEPLYQECIVHMNSSEFALYVELKGCHALFGGETTKTEATPGEHAKVHLTCPEGKVIEIRVTALKLKCIDIPEQTGEGVRYENGESGGVKAIRMVATIHNIKSTKTNSIACPTKSGETEVREGGTYTGEVTLKGHQNELEPASIWIE